MKLFNAGESELLKRNVHGLLGGLVGICLIYNVVAIIQRPKPPRHLYLNALMYFGVAIIEVLHVQHHEESRCVWR